MPAAHDAHSDIYHLVQTHLWEECKASGKTYLPPTYAVDGFTHATADPSKLLGVANYFYKSVRSEWLCLKMTVSPPRPPSRSLIAASFADHFLPTSFAALDAGSCRCDAQA